MNRSVFATLEAEKNGCTVPKALMLVCSRIAINKLPRVWLKTHVKMTARDITTRKKKKSLSTHIRDFR